MSDTESDEPVSNRPTGYSAIIPILIRPRSTMRRLIDSESRAGYRLLPALVGILTAPPAALATQSVIEGHHAMIWVGALALSVLCFWMYVHVYGYAYRLIGGWMGAKGTDASSRLSLAWTQVPFIILWAIVMPLQVIYREDFFPSVDLTAVMSGSTDELVRLMQLEHSRGYHITNNILYIGGFVAWVWSLFVLGAALECPAWKAGLIKLVAVWLHIPLFIILAIPAFALALAFVMLFPPV